MRAHLVKVTLFTKLIILLNLNTPSQQERDYFPPRSRLYGIRIFSWRAPLSEYRHPYLLWECTKVTLCASEHNI